MPGRRMDAGNIVRGRCVTADALPQPMVPIESLQGASSDVVLETGRQLLVVSSQKATGRGFPQMAGDCLWGDVA